MTAYGIPDSEVEFTDSMDSSEKLMQLELENRKLLMQLLQQQFIRGDAHMAVNIEVPKYSGDMKPEVVNTYIVKVNDFIQVKNVTDDKQKLLIFGGKLLDTALMWFKDYTIRNPEDSYETVVQRFKERFISAGWIDQIKREYQTIRQTGDVASYAARFQELLAQLPHDYASEDAMVDRFIFGLKPATQQYVKGQTDYTMQKTVSLAIFYDGTYRNTRRAVGNNAFNAGPNFPQLEPMDIDELRNDSQGFRGYRRGYSRNFRDVDPDRYKAGKYSKGIKCYECGGTGHYARECVNLTKKGGDQH